MDIKNISKTYTEELIESYKDRPPIQYKTITLNEARQMCPKRIWVTEELHWITWEVVFWRHEANEQNQIIGLA